jgi:hypothetical protein
MNILQDDSIYHIILFSSYILIIISYNNTGTEEKVLQQRPLLHNQSAKGILDIIPERGMVKRSIQDVKISRIFP